MPRFASYDGTELSYRVLGAGAPLVCLPGGPGRAAEYLGELGGLDGSRQLILLDLRGVGASAIPTDAATLRVDRLVDDVEALRVHLGLDRMELLAHSAGAILATLYAAAHPQQLARLILITPGLAAVGVDVSDEQLSAGIARFATEPWYAEASAAWDKIINGERTLAVYRASRPFYYGRWDAAAKAHATVGIAERHAPARDGYFAGVELGAPPTREALTRLTAPVLLYGGELDPVVPPALLAEAAPLFGGAAVVVQPGAGHFPWVDDPATFAATVGSFLD